MYVLGSLDGYFRAKSHEFCLVKFQESFLQFKSPARMDWMTWMENRLVSSSVFKESIDFLTIEEIRVIDSDG